MYTIDMENLRGLDLNLLVVLDALLAERSVTRAGTRVGLSQPAVSNALGRLRALLGDPLLVRAGSVMRPTPRALELAGPVRQALGTLERALSPAASFDPATSSRVFRLCATEDLEVTLVPRLLERLGAAAPGVDLVMTGGAGDAEAGLRGGRFDAYLGVWFDIPAALHSHLLRYERFGCIARRGHPAIAGELTLAAYAAAGHVLVTAGERAGRAIDTALTDQGLGRRVVVRTPSLLVAPHIVARTDLIATLPLSVATLFAEGLPLEIYAPPLDTPGLAVHLVWHPRTHDDAPQRWLRQQVMDLGGDAAAW